ncbi:MAG: ATP-binding protein [Candidatus Bathyarchaeia archaeon]
MKETTREFSHIEDSSSSENIFESEFAVIEEAELFLEQDNFTKEEIKEKYRFLIKKYKNLVRHVVKITRIGDAIQSKLIRTQNELDRQNLELAETIKQLKISENKALEASHAKSLFLANMSHELRTPLNAIIGFAQLMERDRSLSHEQSENVRIIMRSGEHLLGLINDVLSLSKIEAGKIVLDEQPFNLRRMLQGIEEMFRIRAQNQDLNFVFNIPNNLPKVVCGDERKLRQILINLIGNAFKFTTYGSVTVSLCQDGDLFHLEVSDTGQGIAPHEMENLFEAFVQTESGRKAKEGTGLGLTISRNFVRLMGGDIRVRSELGKGTTFDFSVRLRVVEEQNWKAPKPLLVRCLQKGQGELKLLVADDNADNRTLLSKLFTSCGFLVHEAVNGKEAVEIWRHWRPHLIWLDMRMSVMDGCEVAQVIRSTEQQNGFEPVKIIALTASAFERDKTKIIKAGCDDFVTKPFQEHTIFELLVKHLNCEFVYEQMDTNDTTVEPEDTGAVFNPLRVAGLPTPLVHELRDTLMLGDTETANSIIDELQTYDSKLASEMRKMVKKYQFDRLFSLLEKTAV